MGDKADVWQGTLALMVLKTIEAMGPLHGYGIARRIEQIMNTDSFYVHYAANRIGHQQVIAKPDSRTVRVYVSRIWNRMQKVFQEVGLKIDPRQILASEPTDSNVIVYRRASLIFSGFVPLSIFLSSES